MRLRDAMDRMEHSEGYRVHFERRENGMLASDYFPERDEPAIADLEEAWKLAASWSRVDLHAFVNIYVIKAFDWTPVTGYDERKLNSYPSAPVVAETEETQ